MSEKKSHKRAVPLSTVRVPELAAMEAVAGQGERSDKSHQERFYRQWLKSDGDGFRKHMMKLRRESMAGAPVDPGSISAIGQPELESAVGSLAEDIADEYRLVLEYRRNREPFLAWLSQQSGGGGGGSGS